MPKISTVIPVFNGAPFIWKAIHSVLNQTFHDLELIVVDDGSTDETARVVKSFSDVRVNYVYQCNQGPNAARNRGIRQAKGEFIAFLDSDDWWLPTKLEVQLARLESMPQAGLVYCSAQRVDLHGNLRGNLSASIEGWVADLLLIDNVIAGSASSVMVRRDVFDKVGLFDEGLRRAEDWEMWLRIAVAFPIAAVQIPLVCITDRPNSNGKEIASLRDDSLVVLEKAFGSYASHLTHLRRKAFARVHFSAGVCFGTIGAMHDARRELIKSLQLDSSNLGAYWRLALTFLGPTPNRWGRRIKEHIRLALLRRVVS